MGTWGDDYLRPELHAVADTIEPAPDGLERIAAKIWSGKRPCGSCQGTGIGLVETIKHGWNCGTCNGTGKV